MKTHRPLRHRSLGVVPATTDEQLIAGGITLLVGIGAGPVLGLIAGSFSLFVLWLHRKANGGRYAHLRGLLARIIPTQYTKGGSR